jgi:hypothetical protein
MGEPLASALARKYPAYVQASDNLLGIVRLHLVLAEPMQLPGRIEEKEESIVWPTPWSPQKARIVSCCAGR